MEDPDEIIDSLILNGELEPTAFDPESGEILYAFTNKLKENSPHIYRLIMNDFHETIMSLWELEIIEMDITDKNPLVRVTNKAFDKNLVETLSELQRAALKEIIRAMKA